MRRKTTGFLFVSIFFIIMLSSAAQAQWTQSGTPISTVADEQYSSKIVPDDAGGAIIAWQDRRNGADYNIYAQRIDGNGIPLWTTDGIAVCTASANQIDLLMIPDGAGGAVIAWHDARNGADYNIYAQRIDGNGIPLWTANGIAVCTAPADQSNFKIIPEGAGGAIIAWQDYRNGTDYDIYAQKIDANGNALWTPDGVAVCTASNHQYRSSLVSDGSGGAIIAWRDDRILTDANIYAQRIDANGTALWTSNGVVVCNEPNLQDFYGPLVSDGYGGAIIAWQDRRNGTNYDIYAQRINANGNYLWEYNGVAVCSELSNQYSPLPVSDGAGGVIIAWEDNRSPYYSYIYAQRVRIDGNVAWTADGVPISTVPGGDYRYLYQPVSDGAGGAVIAWEDYRFLAPPKADIYAQRIDQNGNVRWQTDGALVATWPVDQYSPDIALDGSGGAIFTWYSWDPGGSGGDVYAQRLEINLGNWGRVEPDITAVKDVPGDQGGKIAVEWQASRLDVFDEQTVSYYSVWRALDPMLSPPLSQDLIFDISDISKDFQGRAYRTGKTPAGDYYWEWIGNINALYLKGYAFTAPTLADSTGTNPGWRYFQVAAHTSDPFVFWFSRPDSGYSVDNLSPSAPQGLTGDYSYALGKLTLNWKPNTESDLSHYAVYRDAGVDFIPSDANRIATSTDTMVTGLPYPPVQPYYIKLSALDIHGNESVFAVLPPESVTTPTMVAGFESAWKEGYVEVSWEMSDFPAALDYTIERKQGAGGVYHVLTPDITLDGRKASFKDASVSPGNTYIYRVSAKEAGMGGILFETAVSIPAFKFALYQNYPNPLGRETLISFELPGVMNVELAVYDAGGRKVATILRDRKGAGLYKVPFKADGLASGVYFYKLKAGSRTLSRKMTVVR